MTDHPALDSYLELALKAKEVEFAEGFCAMTLAFLEMARRVEEIVARLDGPGLRPDGFGYPQKHYDTLDKIAAAMQAAQAVLVEETTRVQPPRFP